MTNKYKKRIRLQDFDYQGHYRYFITVCTHNKYPLFGNNGLADNILESLRDKAKSFGFKVWAYCFMPDHLHFLVEGLKPDSNMKRFISSFKQTTGYYYKRQTDRPLWQINYYEHVLRKDEDLRTVARYIFNNPVRKGLVESYRNYKLLGSFEFDINEL